VRLAVGRLSVSVNGVETTDAVTADVPAARPNESVDVSE
jgi:hypothetical protein